MTNLLIGYIVGMLWGLYLGYRVGQLASNPLPVLETAEKAESDQEFINEVRAKIRRNRKARP